MSTLKGDLNDIIENDISISKRKRFIRRINKIVQSKRFKIMMVTALAIGSLISFHTPTRNFVISMLNIIKYKLSNVESSLENTDSHGLENKQIKNKRALVFLAISLTALVVSTLNQNGNQSVQVTAQTGLDTTGNPEVPFSRAMRDNGIIFGYICLIGKLFGGT